MAKSVKKTNALGLELNPESFIVSESSVSEESAVLGDKLSTPDLLVTLETDKSTIKGFSFTLHAENVEKLRKLAKQRGVSASKLLDHILAEVIK